MHNSRFSTECKWANVHPVYKKDDPLIKKIYRPVSVVTSISKAFEKLIDKQYENFQQVVSHKQLSAFRAKFGCNHVLLELTEQY